jgi:hypothetical protein
MSFFVPLSGMSEGNNCCKSQRLPGHSKRLDAIIHDLQRYLASSPGVAGSSSHIFDDVAHLQQILRGGLAYESTVGHGDPHSI